MRFSNEGLKDKKKGIWIKNIIDYKEQSSL